MVEDEGETQTLARLVPRGHVDVLSTTVNDASTGREGEKYPNVPAVASVSVKVRPYSRNPESIRAPVQTGKKIESVDNGWLND